MSIDYDKIAKEIVEEHTTFTHWKTGEKTTSYDPVDWGQGGSDTDHEAMSLFISGVTVKDETFPKWREYTNDIIMDWESDAVFDDAEELTKQYMTVNGEELEEGFDEYDLRDAVRDLLYEANTQDVGLEWIKRMDNPIVRVMLTDEDHPDSWVENDEDWTPERIATNAGIEHTEKNLKACKVILDNAYYPGTCKMLFLVFRLDLDNVKDDSDTVHLKGEAELWACNPFQGDGMADTVDVDLTIPRSRLATDKEAAGYSYDEVFGPSYSGFPEPDVEFTKADNKEEVEA